MTWTETWKAPTLVDVRRLVAAMDAEIAADEARRDELMGEAGAIADGIA